MVYVFCAPISHSLSMCYLDFTSTLSVIDCRLPLDVFNGVYRLMNKTTFYNSVVSYECDPNYVLVGNRTRTCTEYGTWSNAEPSCERMFYLFFNIIFRLLLLLLAFRSI